MYFKCGQSARSLRFTIYQLYSKKSARKTCMAACAWATCISLSRGQFCSVDSRRIHTDCLQAARYYTQLIHVVVLINMECKMLCYLPCTAPTSPTSPTGTGTYSPKSFDASTIPLHSTLEHFKHFTLLPPPPPIPLKRSISMKKSHKTKTYS